MLFLFCFANMLGLLLFWRKYAEIGLERIYFTIFVSCYVFTYFGGILLAAALSSMLGIEKIGVPDGTAWRLVILSEICLGLLVLGYVIASPIKKIVTKRDSLNWNKNTKVFICVLLVSFFVAMAAYIVGSGGVVLFKEGGYENRYDANVGMGGYSLFFSMGLLGCTMLSLRAETKRKKRIALGCTIAYCVMTFVVLGGYRQLGFASLFSFGVIALMRGDISFLKFTMFSGLLVIITLAVAMLRYTGTSADDVGGVYGRLIIFLYDGFAPVDAFYNIVEYSKNHEISENVFVNQFLTVIPRAIWSDKPLVVLNAGNFYTQVVIGRTDAITYSPTLLGELYLIGGNVMCCAGVFVSGIALRVLDEIVIRSRKKILVAFFFSFSFVFVFNLYREGVSVFLTKIMLFGVVSVMLSAFSKLLRTVKKGAYGIRGC
ncbi:WzyE family oligosaccharide polymerase [Paraburkholderia sp. EG287A]|uniref:WzyE family oligosaccharide polymerase n=1 Tax=unclassified Paraburkholderia TaxID=2615204 RepID=UPI0034D33A29